MHVKCYGKRLPASIEKQYNSEHSLKWEEIKVLKVGRGDTITASPSCSQRTISTSLSGTNNLLADAIDTVITSKALDEDIETMSIQFTYYDSHGFYNTGILDSTYFRPKQSGSNMTFSKSLFTDYNQHVLSNHPNHLNDSDWSIKRSLRFQPTCLVSNPSKQLNDSGLSSKCHLNLDQYLFPILQTNWTIRIVIAHTSISVSTSCSCSQSLESVTRIEP